MADNPKDQDELTEEEAAKRRDAVIKRMLETPPQPRKSKPPKPHKPIKDKKINVSSKGESD